MVSILSLEMYIFTLLHAAMYDKLSEVIPKLHKLVAACKYM